MPASPLSPPVSGPLCTSRVGRTQMQVPPRRNCFIWAGHPGHTLLRHRAETLSPGRQGLTVGPGALPGAPGFRSYCVQRRPPLPPACVLSRVSHLSSHKERPLVRSAVGTQGLPRGPPARLPAPPAERVLASGSALPPRGKEQGLGLAPPPSAVWLHVQRGRAASTWILRRRAGWLCGTGSAAAAARAGDGLKP